MGTGANTGLVPEDICTYKYHTNIKHVVCIPACNETSLLPVLHSLNALDHAEGLAIVLVINAAENADENVRQTNKKAFEELTEYLKSEELKYPLWAGLYNHLPAKKAGVGLARKLAMDKACELIGKPGKENILLCLDADCTVQKNWATCVIEHFHLYIQTNAASVYFLHPETADQILNQGILFYELHLRYLKNCLQWAGYPWYFHTVGSSMALRAETYQKSGGMNTRQAGEDFYFLHKLMPLGFGEINDTTVFPATRYSNRVPFGTGRSMLEFKENGIQTTYNFSIFQELKKVFDMAFLPLLKWDQNCGVELKNILKKEGIESAVEDAIEHSGSEEMAIRRFKNWFSGFRIIRIMHALRDSGFEDVEVESEAKKLLDILNIHSEESTLESYRKLDRTQIRVNK